MIRCVRLWTATDDNSHFEEGTIALARGARGDVLTDKLPVTTVSFQEAPLTGGPWARQAGSTARIRAASSGS